MKVHYKGQQIQQVEKKGVWIWQCGMYEGSVSAVKRMIDLTPTAEQRERLRLALAHKEVTDCIF